MLPGPKTALPGHTASLADLSRHSPAIRGTKAECQHANASTFAAAVTVRQVVPTSAWFCRHCLSRRSLGEGGSPGLRPGCPRNIGANGVTTREGLRQFRSL
jgi:hypothetical protein